MLSDPRALLDDVDHAGADIMHFIKGIEGCETLSRLRSFVLDLAVRGRLVDQNSADEPAFELLQRIAVEKTRKHSSRHGQYSKASKSLVCEDNPYQLPAAWTWTSISKLGLLNPRNDIHDDHVASFVPMRMIPAKWDATHAYEVCSWGEIKKGYTHFSNGDVGLAKITPCFENGKSVVFRNLAGGFGSGTTELYIIRPLFVSAVYILLFLKSPVFIQAGIPKMTGTAGQKRLPKDHFANSPFPLPPLAEQHRIVTKVDELMALCDRLEEAQKSVNESRNLLTKASFGRLNDSKTDDLTFHSISNFVINQFPVLTRKADQVKTLRQSILNLAIRGKLVAQDPAEGSALELLPQIALEKERLVKIGVIKKQKHLPPVISPPFEIPKNWCWTRIRQVTSDRGQIKPDSDFTYIDLAAIDKENGSVIEPTIVLPNDAPSRARKIVKEGDVIFSCAWPSQQNIAIITECYTPKPIVSTAFAVLNGHGLVLSKYLWCALRSPFMISCVALRQRGQLYPTIRITDFDVLPFPLPPLGEQHRIVAKVDELMALCDRLESNLEITSACRASLFESLVSNTLQQEKSTRDSANTIARGFTV